MNGVLEMCRNMPIRALGAGETLITEGTRITQLYVIRSGAFEVLRNGASIAWVDEPGVFLGEISAVLDSATTATVIAGEASEVYVIENAGSQVRTNLDLAYFVAQLLARRLSSLTSYLVDMKQQPEDSESDLALMDQVLASIVAGNFDPEPDSPERDDLADD